MALPELTEMLIRNNRQTAPVQHYPLLPHIDRAEVRDHPHMGTTAIAPGLAISGQTYPIADSQRPLQSSDDMRSCRKLFAVPERSTARCRKRWCEQDEGHGLGVAGHSPLEGIQSS